MTRTVFATALAVLAMFAFTAVGSGAPPTGGITASCAIDGESVVSGFKGNPDRVDFFWTTADGFASTTSATSMSAASSAPCRRRPRRCEVTDEEPWSPLTFSVVYKETVTFTETVPCA